ncbi:cobyrinate a,c-diamide synthase [Piscinibacter gummiphilus]|uniref:Cobyrinic acid a,c-diamide synthase n=1 Tax=Piscinibacter gummiphilus TaxID=946333 RepID=A0A1W6L773_9BURK|nr:cobyrinate a,c-diamide synthase [Piscinibacter gummiphilus]ARN20084.1 cobyrinic acid a,c-diamide synthase [Piscinibacter gummiphilus]ATU64755.1 cobyrinate a,c-diamide synthase [Piscinibacter gummiphilus]GLS97014.1 hydrogenobyrinate a,c-diamide synthase [Piscinibacter gummiphilus]
MTARCRALMVSAPASGQGKTSVTAAIARHHVRRGERVRVFKTGPDFLDPMVLARASGAPVFQLDLFMAGEDACRRMLAEAAAEADLILVEGVMGLYDSDPSSADLARTFGLPVLAVIDASAMAQTFGALAHGLATFQPGVAVAGVVANRVGSPGHARMVGESLPTSLPLVAALGRDAALSLPERHLGLVQAGELPDLDARLDRWADAWAAAVAPDFEAPSVDFESAPDEPVARLLDGVVIAVARDTAFSFIYPANVQCLERLGARLVWFSPLADDTLPPCDAVWLPGGYPELHASTLGPDRPIAAALRAHDAAGKPLLAECGGLLYLLDGLSTVDGTRHPMAGVLPGEGTMSRRLAALGLQSVALPEGTVRGHTFHYSVLSTPLEPLARATSPNGRGTAEAVYRRGRLTASYVHTWFPSNPVAVASWFRPWR